MLVEPVGVTTRHVKVNFMRKTVSYLRKVAALIIGVPLFIVGLILIPLPGPGLLVCFVALFIISLEFDWAEPHLERSKAEIKKIIQKSQDRSKNIKDK